MSQTGSAIAAGACAAAKRMGLAVAFASMALSASAMLDVIETNGTFAVMRDGRTIVQGVKADLGGDGRRPEERRSFSSLPDGSKVWNVWSEQPDRRYRLEIARRADGAVEMTLAGQTAAGSPYTTRRLYLFVPSDVFEGRGYDALQGNGRSCNPKKGRFDNTFRRNGFRWLASDGLVWDFNPVGAGSYCNMYASGTIQGVWTVIRRSGGRPYELSSGSSVRGRSGNLTGTKIVIREGVDGDYAKHHHLRSFHYNQPCHARYAVSLGASRFGKSYVDGDAAFDPARGFGWVGDVSRIRNVGHPSGAYYAHVCGNGAATYRFAGLADGFHVFTLQVGNWTGEGNRFSVHVNGEELCGKVSVPGKTARTISRVMRITGGRAEVMFDGDWMVSAIAVQPLMADGEDFSVRRGMWLTDGYEPCILYRSCDFARPMEFGTLDESIVMPEPGRESMAEPRDPPRKTGGLNPDDAGFDWLRRAKTYSFAGNASSFYFAKEGEGSVADIFAADTEGMGYNVAFVSGLHSRHTYIGHEERGIEVMREIARIAHGRGMKVIDHHDATLLWNEMGGFRAMMSRLPETIRSVHDNLPSFQLCPNNPVFKEKYFAYLRKLVEAGVDGFQLDEVVFWAHGCACKACREKFRKETGWYLPLDETDETFSDWRSRIARRWHAWKVVCVANWFAELKQSVADIKPDLAILMYSTHWGMVASHPKYGLVNDLMGLGRVVNYFGTEVMTRNPMQSSRSLMPYRRMMNMFTIAYGSPVWGIYYGDTDEGGYFSWAVANMLGQSALLHGRRSGRKETFIPWGASPLNMNRDGAENVAEVALLFSAYSRDWNQGVPFIEEEFGLAQELEALHIPYEIIGDFSVDAAHLKKYKVLCLGASLCLSDAEISAIKNYLADGGTVYAAVEAGICDEFGERRGKWPLEGARGRFIYRPDMRASAFCAREAEVNAVWKFNPDRNEEKALRVKLADVMSAGRCWDVSAPDTVFTTIWKEADGRLVVHFVNASGACLRPGEKITSAIPREPFPPIEDDIVFSFPGKTVKSAVAASPDFEGSKTLSIADGEAGSQVVLPKSLLRVYVAVRIEFRRVQK